MVDCVEKTEGVVDKFIGDAVMAHWGTAYSAGSPQQDAFNCVKAALMMREALNAMNNERKAGDPADPIIKIGCGINTGIVTAGQLGSDMRMEYTVIGDPVNLASRIEALTKPLGVDILISEDTWLLTKDKFITEEMPSVTVKGKEKPVRIFAVVNFAGADKGPQAIADVRKLLNLETPELSKVDVNADEKKYKIGDANLAGKN
jgi:adenylate cyclase